MQEETKFAPNDHMYPLANKGLPTSMGTPRTRYLAHTFPPKVFASDTNLIINFWHSDVTTE